MVKKLDLRNNLGDINVFDFIFNLVEIWGQIFDLEFDSKIFCLQNIPLNSCGKITHFCYPKGENNTAQR